MWKDIANQMEKSGYKYNWKQTREKWKNLKKMYTKHKENRGPKATGQKKLKEFEFFDELDEILGKRHNIEPVVLATSSKGIICV